MMKNSACILWLEGVNPEMLSAVPGLAELAQEGVDIRLTPLPLVEKSVCYYQTLTGMGAGKLGRFDATYPEAYAARAEEGMPEGALGHLLPDILRARKSPVIFLEARDAGALYALAEQPYDCAIVRFDARAADEHSLETIVQHCRNMKNPETHLLVLTDVCRPEPHTLVNSNDFLADVGLLEVGESRCRDDIVWHETLAYGLGQGQIWVNLRGREQQGCVSSHHEYQEVCDALIDELRTGWLDPDSHEPVVERVLRKEEAYHGDYLFKAPDLIVAYRPGYAASPRARQLDFDGTGMRRSGSPVSAVEQPPYGRLLAIGPGLASGFSGTASLLDVMPSMLYLLGQSIPVNVDGTIITSMFTKAYCRQTPVERVGDAESALSAEDEGLIVDRLRALGYLG